MRSTPSELSIEWPPSTPINEATLPALWMRTTSSTVRAISNVSGYALTIRLMTSICSSVSRTAVPFLAVSAGT